MQALFSKNENKIESTYVQQVPIETLSYCYVIESLDKLLEYFRRSTNSHLDRVDYDSNKTFFKI